MQREILFRGRRIDNREWVYGGYFQHTPDEDGPRFYIFSFYGGAMEVIPETIGQFTGLTDKNGNKIFEGDIVKHLIFYKSSMSSEDLWGTEPQNSKTVYEEYLDEKKGTVVFENGCFKMNSQSLESILYDLGNEVQHFYLCGFGDDVCSFIECFEGDSFDILKALEGESFYERLKIETDNLAKKTFEIIGNIHEKC